MIIPEGKYRGIIHSDVIIQILKVEPGMDAVFAMVVTDPGHPVMKYVLSTFFDFYQKETTNE
jgi:hypothetical protein